MRTSHIFFCSIAVLSFLLSTVGQTQQQPSSAQAAAGSDSCKTYFAIQPLDPGVMQLLATPIVPPHPNEFANAGIKQLEEWDLPSKVTAWRERPSSQDLSRRWDELNKKFNPAQNPGVARPYGLGSLSADDWQDLEKWFAKEGPKRVSGICVDQAKATYVLAVGIISDRSTGVPLTNPHDQNTYQHSASASRQDSGVGANAATYSPAAHENSPHDLPGVVSASDRSAYTCTFLFRTNNQGGARQAAPDYYYCKGAGVMPKSAVSTMLKYLAKASL